MFSFSSKNKVREREEEGEGAAMAQSREFWLRCLVAVAPSKINLHHSCHRVTDCLDTSAGFFSRLQLLKGLDSATFIFCAITRNEEEQRLPWALQWDFCTGRSGAGKNWGCGRAGTVPGTGLEEGAFLEVFGDVFSKVFFTFHQPNLQLALCVSKANSRLP